MNRLSQARLAPTRPFMEEGQWANRSSRLSQRLKAVRKIWRVTAHYCPETPRKESQRAHKDVFILSSALLHLLTHTRGVIQVSIFHWGVTLCFLSSTSEGFSKIILMVVVIVSNVTKATSDIKCTRNDVMNQDFKTFDFSHSLSVQKLEETNHKKIIFL